MVHAIGESLYDLTFSDVHQVWACPGGSMLNTAVSLGRRKIPVRFYTEMGNDRAGKLLHRFLDSNNIDTGSIHIYEGKTSLALAFLDDNGDAAYEFYPQRPETAPEFILPEIQPGDIMLFGSTYARQPRNHKNILNMVQKLKMGGGLLVYDPNYRITANNEGEILNLVAGNIGLSDIVRGSDQDFFNLFGVKDGIAAFREIQRNGSKILIYTRNRAGVDLFTPWFSKHYEVPDIQVVSTIGAGDNFNAGLIAELHGMKFIPETEKFWDEAIDQAIIFASEVCTSKNNFVDWS
jgi:fructokinase